MTQDRVRSARRRASRSLRSPALGRGPPTRRGRRRARRIPTEGIRGLFSGKVVWITGAGTGIGRAGALMFAGERATVALMGRRRAQLDEAAGEIAAKGGQAVVAPVDVADRPEVDRVGRELIAELGRVDILVNNAGLNVLGNGRRMENLTPEDFFS